MDKFRDAFLVETGKLLDEFGALLLKNEGLSALSAEDAERLFRILHTVKGSAGMMEMDALSALTHALEDIFVYLKKSPPPPADRLRGLFDLLFEALDAMRACVDAFARGAESVSTASLVVRAGIWRENSVTRACLRALFTPDCAMENVRGYLIFASVKAVAPDAECFPRDLEGDENAAKFIRDNGLYLSFPAPDEGRVREILEKDIYVSKIEIAPGFPDAAPPAPASEPEPAAETGYVSVSALKLDALQNLVSEVILRQRGLLSELGADDRPDARRLSRRAENLRDAVTALRVTPIAPMFVRLHRAAREAGRKLNREIAFIAKGGEVEIDRSLQESVAESLLQLIRNAVVHGIEPSGERLMTGKPLMGTVTVTARNTGTNVVLSVSDDGRGVDAEKLRAAAAGADADMPLLDLMVMPGVTTTDEADELSGRGMGLDVVNSAITRLRGELSVTTAPGVGTTFTARLPQSLSVMNCVRFLVADTAVYLPAMDIYTLVASGLTGGEKHLRFRDYSLPLIDLGAFLGLRAGDNRPQGGAAIIIEGEKSAVAVYADKVIGPERVNIRPLPGLISALGAEKHGIAGATVLPDGRIGFVLDAEALLRAGEAE